MTTHSTLLLNSDYSPLKIVSWQRAVHLWFDNKVEIVEVYDDFELKSMRVTIKCPAVIRLLSYVSRRDTKLKFSRVNVFGRDNFQCQYCDKQPGTSELTYDHVIPRSQGGTTVWENIVTACVPCNSKKGSRTPAEAGMKLKRKPVRPPMRVKNQFTFHLPKTPEAWRSYLYWNQELEHD